MITRRHFRVCMFTLSEFYVCTLFINICIKLSAKTKRKKDKKSSFNATAFSLFLSKHRRALSFSARTATNAFSPNERKEEEKRERERGRI